MNGCSNAVAMAVFSTQEILPRRQMEIVIDRITALSSSEYAFQLGI
jgi:hypothetical protein